VFWVKNQYILLTTFLLCTEVVMMRHLYFLWHLKQLRVFNMDLELMRKVRYSSYLVYHVISWIKSVFLVQMGQLKGTLPTILFFFCQKMTEIQKYSFLS